MNIGKTLSILLLSIFLLGVIDATRDLKDLRKDHSRLVVSSKDVDFADSYVPVPLPDVNTKRQTNGVTIYQTSLWFTKFWFVNEELVFGLTATGGTIWRSVNSMLSWNTTNLVINRTDAMFDFHPKPTDHSTILALGSTESAWLTNDAGLTWSVFYTQPVQNVRWHPTSNTIAALATSRGRSTGALVISTDTGRTWKTTPTSNVRGFAWCGSALCLIADINSNSASGGGPRRFIRSTDNGQTWTTILDFIVETFLHHSEFIFVLTNAQETGQPALYVSKDDGATFSQAFLPAQVPYIQAEQVLDYSEAAIWLALPPSDIKPMRIGGGSIYNSDSEGLRYVNVLDNVLTYRNWWDFDAIRSMEGAYLANVIENAQSTQESPNFEVSPIISSYFTFDNGGTWRRITYEDNSTYVNLYGVTTWLGIGGFQGEFYSDANSIGLVIGTGNLGEHLDVSGSNVSTFMSRDGGRTFFKIWNASTVYEYADHGGILVMSESDWTTTISYSLNEGLTWNALNLPTRARVHQIFSISSTAKHVVILAVTASGNVVYWGIDFSQIHQNPCTADDYEPWTPHNECVLGRQTTYLRRKRSATCYNDKYWNHTQSSVNCNCTADDYECDFNYFRAYQGGPCINYWSAPEIPCGPDGKRVVSQGYRRVAGDTCVNDLPNYAPKIETCNPSGGTTAAGQHSGQVYGTHGTPGWAVALIIVIVFVLLIVALVGGVVLGARSERLRHMFPFLGRFQPRSNHYDTQLPIDEVEVE
eukprot:TRINITY_DN3430_c0_g1_i2.p1 TRINITY_DN3430_c0_g1~~TRINITY_DN3430_c0_g1_i2.p1  ORF type:complete len:756 (-),score=129.80 TRINITY_DN3430_c0_g1_i2:20-2287(-)